MKQTGWALSIAGLVPFIGLTLTQLATPSPDTLHALLAYAAVILAFLGGIQWGIGMRIDGDSKQSSWVMGLSIFPSLIAWAALLQSSEILGILMAVAGLLSALAVDYYLHRMEVLTDWFWAMRWRISALAVSCLLLALIG
ncbi:MAG: DUF3429 domain-containing protein [Rickettsiales bacterium]|nr:DUF3429 domain-containing protein [Rickettsiales bacterium]